MRYDQTSVEVGGRRLIGWSKAISGLPYPLGSRRTQVELEQTPIGSLQPRKVTVQKGVIFLDLTEDVFEAMEQRKSSTTV